MSLLRSCIRVCTVACLKSRPWQGVRVYDSDNRPLDEAVATETGPYVVVYTDDDDIDDIDDTSIDLVDFTGTRSMFLTVEFGVTRAMAAAEDPNQGPTIAIPPTDAFFELYLDAQESRIRRALWSDPDSPWAVYLKNMCYPRRMLRKRGGKAEEGARIAARQIVFVLGPRINEPSMAIARGNSDPIKSFITAAMAAPENLEIDHAARFLNAELTELKDDISWRQAMAALGATKEHIELLGLTPYLIPDESEGAVLQEGDLHHPWQSPPHINIPQDPYEPQL